MFSGTKVLAQAALTQLHYSKLNDSLYQITLAINQETAFNIFPLNKQNKLTLDLYNTAFGLKKLPDIKLDRQFINSIYRVNKKSNSLRLILELAPNASLKKYFSRNQAGQLFITLEISNGKLSSPLIMTKTKSKQYVIMIDPGHGGLDHGTLGLNPEMPEKLLALLYAKELRKELLRYPQYKVLMTRETDEYLSLNARKQKTYQEKADLFISLHVDSNIDSKLHGASIYTLSQEALDQESIELAERENKADNLKIKDIQDEDIINILVDMKHKGVQNSSISLAEFSNEELSKEIDMIYNSHRVAGFKLLKEMNAAAILIELGHLSNPEEAALLCSYNYRKRVIKALVEGINRYINQL
jgi:N-acetylmuramoyl-L-alanine amidase